MVSLGCSYPRISLTTVAAQAGALLVWQSSGLHTLSKGGSKKNRTHMLRFWGFRGLLLRSHHGQAFIHLKLFSDDTQTKLLSLVRHSQTLNWQDVDWVRPYRADTLVHSQNPRRRELPGSSLTCAYVNTLSKKETLKSHSEDRADSNPPEPTSKTGHRGAVLSSQH